MNDENQDVEYTVIYGRGRNAGDAIDEFNRKMKPNFERDIYVTYTPYGSFIISELDNVYFVYQQVLVQKQKPQE